MGTAFANCSAPALGRPAAPRPLDLVHVSVRFPLLASISMIYASASNLPKGESGGLCIVGCSRRGGQYRDQQTGCT